MRVGPKKNGFWPLFLVLNLTLLGMVRGQSFYFKGAREKSLAGISVMMYGSAHAGLFNPANLAMLRQPVFYLNVNRLFEYDQAAVANSFPQVGAFGICLGRMKSYVVADYVNLGFGRGLGNGFNAGIALQLYQQNSVFSLEWNLGLSFLPVYREKQMAKLDRFGFALSLQNASLGKKRLGPPLRLSMGAFYQVLPDFVNILGEIRLQKANNAFLSGIELYTSDFTVIRTGISNFDQNFWFGGFGLRLGTFQVDFVYDRFLKKIEFSCKIPFGEIPKEKAKRYFEEGEQLIAQKKIHSALKKYRSAAFFYPENRKFRERVLATKSLLQKLEAIEKEKLEKAQQFENAGEYLAAYLRYYDLSQEFPENILARQKVLLLKNQAKAKIPDVIPDIRDLVENGNLREAKIALIRLQEIAPEDTTLHRFYQQVNTRLNEQFSEYYYRGLGYLAQRKFSAAKESFQEALRLKPEDEQARRNLEEAEHQLYQKQAKVDSLLVLARQNEEKQQIELAIHLYGSVLELDGNQAEARRALERLKPKVDIHVKSLLADAKSELQKKRYAKAEQLCREILRIRFNHKPAHDLLATIRQRRQSEARSYWQQGNELMKSRQFEKAVLAFRMASRLVPNDSKYSKSLQNARAKLKQQKLWQEVQEHLHNNRFVEAESGIRTLLAAEPQNQDYLAFLDKLQLQRNRFITFLLQQGIKLYSEEKYEEAIKTFVQLLQYDSSNQTAQDYKKRIEIKLKALKKLK